jgi:hypothetical protein
MYEAMSLAMLASGAPTSEVERALMSAVDFSRNDEEVLHIARYRMTVGLEERSLKLLRSFSAAYPFRPEPYLNGLTAAQRLDDEDGIRWACVGILSQAWPGEQQEVAKKASRVAEALFLKMKEENRQEDMKAFAAELNQAQVRDCIVRISWTGEADIDLSVEEPSATVCSARNPRTTAGGVMLGDAFAQREKQSVDGYSETYVCPQGFAGQYRLFLRRVWGEVTAGKVTVEICMNYGTESQTYGKQQIPLGEKDAVVNFDLPDGRRQEPLAEQKLARLDEARMQVGQAVLAQQFSDVQDSSAMREYLYRTGRLGGSRFTPLMIGRSRGVGFRPIVTPFPEGNQMSSMAVISADRRYVRFSLLSGAPIASGITNVDTFQFAGGTTAGVGGGAGGGVGGGIGGGVF